MGRSAVASGAQRRKIALTAQIVLHGFPLSTATTRF